jgi:DNA-binding SARP family transcriptional activator
MLELRILGQFDVQLDGKTIEIASRPAQSLFAYLCFHQTVQHRREKLAGMLWPDSDESNARSNLRHALWRLGESVGKGQFLADKLSIAINPDAELWVDVAAFEAVTDDDSLEAVLSAVQLYLGELLPGFYDDWVELERERLRAAYDRKVERLIALQLEAGRWAAAIQWAERWIAEGHVPESAFRSLMIAHHALGDVAKVVSTYERCRAILREDLDVEPSSETRQLFQELTQQGVSGDSLRVPEPEGPSRGFDAQPVISGGSRRQAWLEENGSGVFVGREKQLDELERMLSVSLQGQGQLAMIVGEAGSGKTTLATSFAREVLSKRPDMKVAIGRCDLYTGAGNPYAPFQSVLGALLEQGTAPVENGGAKNGDRVSELSPTTRWLRQRLMAFAPDLLGTMIPKHWLSTSLVDKPPQPHSWEEAVGRIVVSGGGSGSASVLHRNRVLEAYADVLLGYSAQRPLLIVLDDLHWIDPSSANLLRFLASEMQNSPMLLVGTYRPDEIGPRPDGAPHPLAEVLPDLKRVFGDMWLDVEQSDPEDARIFVDQLLETQSIEVGPGFRQSLADTTRGHPFFVLELIKDLQERGGLIESEGGTWVEAEGLDLGVLPTRVEAVVEDRVGRLDAEMLEAVSIASVQGDDFIAEVVAEIQQVDPAALVRRLTDELGREHRLVEEVGIERVQGQLLTRFAFRHVLIQKYLYQRLGKGERAYLHEATGRGLERVYAASDFPPASQLARHYVEAGLGKEAAAYLQLAGEQALKVSAYPEAIAHLMQARRLSPAGTAEEAGANRVAQARQERLLGEAHYGLGDLGKSSAHLERAAKHLGKAVPHGTSHVGLGLAGEILVQGLRLAFGSHFRAGPGREAELFHEAAVTYKLLAEIYLVRNETLLTVYAAVRGLNLAENSGSHSDLARAYADATVIAPLLRLRGLGERYRQRALQQVELDEGSRARAYVDLSTSIYTLGEANWGAAHASIEAANHAHEQAGDWNRLGVGLMLMANYLSLRGENEASLETYLRLCALAERSGNTQHLAWGIDGRAKCLIRRGEKRDLVTAVELLARSVAMLKDEGMHQEEVEALGFLAFAQWSLGRPEAALSAAEKASLILERSAPNFFSQVEGYAGVVRTYLLAWEAETVSGGKPGSHLRQRTAHAVNALDRLARIFPVCVPRATIWHASLDWMGNRRASALRGWQKGLKLAIALEMPYEEALAHLELGSHLSQGDADRSRHLKLAEDLFKRQSAAGELALVRKAKG